MKNLKNQTTKETDHRSHEYTVDELNKISETFSCSSLMEMMARAMSDQLDKQIEADITKYFPISREPEKRDDSPKFQSAFVTKRYVDQFLNTNENSNEVPERNKIEEMINYGKED